MNEGSGPRWNAKEGRAQRRPALVINRASVRAGLEQRRNVVLEAVRRGEVQWGATVGVDRADGRAAAYKVADGRCGRRGRGRDDVQCGVALVAG